MASIAAREPATHRWNPLRPAGYAVVILWSALTFLPLLWMYYSSLKTPHELVTNRWLPPMHPTFGNFSDAWTGKLQGYSNIIPLERYAINSVIVTFISLAATLAIAAPAAYALARHRLPGEKTIMRGLLLSLAIPVQALILPIWAIESRLQLTDRYIGLILPYVGTAMPGALLLLTAYLRSFPPELEEAGRVDGLTNFGVLTRIVLPLSRGPLAAIGILLANGFWSEFMFALILMPEGHMQTLPVGIVAYSGGFYVPMNLILAALAMMTAPVLLLYLVFQRQITSANFQIVKG